MINLISLLDQKVHIYNMYIYIIRYIIDFLSKKRKKKRVFSHINICLHFH